MNGGKVSSFIIPVFLTQRKKKIRQYVHAQIIPLAAYQFLVQSLQNFYPFLLNNSELLNFEELKYKGRSHLVKTQTTTMQNYLFHLVAQASFTLSEKRQHDTWFISTWKTHFKEQVREITAQSKVAPRWEIQVESFFFKEGEEWRGKEEGKTTLS